MDRAVTRAQDNSALMDSVYRNQRHIYDLTRKFYLLGRDHLIDELRPPEGGTVLEVGCGTGRNLIKSARRYPYALFHGFDISNEMLRTAEANIARAKLQTPVRLAAADAGSFDAKELFGIEKFDRIVFSYTLSMIPPWREAIAMGLRHLKPGGRVHIVDFGQQERLPSAFQRSLFAWLKKFHVTPRADLAQVLETQTAEHDCTVVFRPLYRGYSWYAELESQPE